MAKTLHLLCNDTIAMLTEHDAKASITKLHTHNIVKPQETKSRKARKPNTVYVSSQNKKIKIKTLLSKLKFLSGSCDRQIRKTTYQVN